MGSIFDGVGEGGTLGRERVVIFIETFSAWQPIVNQLGDKIFTVVCFANSSAVSVPVNVVVLLGSPVVAFADVRSGEVRGGKTTDGLEEAVGYCTLRSLDAHWVTGNVEGVLGYVFGGVLIRSCLLIRFNAEEGGKGKGGCGWGFIMVAFDMGQRDYFQGAFGAYNGLEDIPFRAKGCIWVI